MHKNATKCNETLSKWCENKHGALKIIDTFETYHAAKTAAEKSTKSAVAKAKKAEKALADADRDRVQREQDITKCLNQILALAGGKYLAFPFFV
jgi:hypothetical protein